MTNDEAVKQALAAVATYIDDATTGRIDALRADIEENRTRMPREAFEIYEVIKRARIEGIEWAASMAGKAIIQQEPLTAESKR